MLQNYKQAIPVLVLCFFFSQRCADPDSGQTKVICYNNYNNNNNNNNLFNKPLGNKSCDTFHLKRKIHAKGTSFLSK